MADDLIYQEGTGSKKIHAKERTANIFNEVVELNIGGASESLWNGHVTVDNATIAGSAGSPNAGVLSVQGLSGMTPVIVQGQQGPRNTGSFTANSQTLGPWACSNFNVATVVVSGTYASVTFVFEGSDDGGTTWVQIQGVRTDSFAAETGGTLLTNTTRAWDIAIGAFTHFRVRDTAWSSGTAVIGCTFQSMPYEPSPTVGLQAIGGVNVPLDNAGFTDGVTPVVPGGYILDDTAGTALTENDIAAARIDSKRAQAVVLEDATTRGQKAAVDSSGRQLINVGQYAGQTPDMNSGAAAATTPRVVLATRHEAAATPLAARISQDGTNFMASGYPLFVQGVPMTAAANALSLFVPSSGNIVAGVVKASAGNWAGMYVQNNVAAVTWIQFFNSTSTPTLGTSVVFAIPVAASAALYIWPGMFALYNFSTGIAWGAATTYAGASAPATAPTGACWYK
jgi:hypothetical protein